MAADFLRQYLTEGQIMKRLDLTKKELDYLRQRKDFPFIPLGQQKRIYDTQEIAAWFAKDKKITVPGSDQEKSTVG